MGPGAGESPATMSHRHQLCWGPSEPCVCLITPLPSRVSHSQLPEHLVSLVTAKVSWPKVWAKGTSPEKCTPFSQHLNLVLIGERLCKSVRCLPVIN